MADNGQPKTICILQLTRIGDILQTYQACLSAKTEYPHARLILVARKRFAKGLEFILKDIFFKTILLDEAEILGDHDSLRDSRDRLKKLVTTINAFTPDVVVNLSFCKPSSYLSSMISAKFRLGMHYNLQGDVSISDTWSQYLYSTVMTGPLNPFSLVDIYRHLVGTSAPTLTDNLPKSNNILTIHPFASHEKKYWKVEKWGEIVFKLLKDRPNLRINIVGASNEADEAKKLASLPILKPYQSRLFNLVGETTLEQLAEVLKQSSLFIGHDSMVGHLSSIIGCKTLTIALGTVRPIETIPWGDGNFVLSPRTSCYPCFPKDSCSGLKCHSDIPYQVVLECSKQLLDQQSIDLSKLESSVSCFHLEGTLIQRSSISSAGYLQLVTLGDFKPTLRELMHQFYRIVWLYTFDHKEEPNTLPVLNSQNYDLLLKTLKGLEHAYELTEFGKKYSRYILTELAKEGPSLQEIKTHSKKIDEIDKLLRVIKDNYPSLAPMINYHQVARQNLHGDNIVQMTENSYLNFEEQGTTCGVLFELIEKSLTEYRHRLDQTDGVPTV